MGRLLNPLIVAGAGVAAAALLAGGTVLMTARRPPSGPPRSEIEAVVAELDAIAREASASVTARAATLAEIPRLAAAVATDAATVRDLSGEELSFRPREGEIIEIGQIPKDGPPISLLRLPAGATFAAQLHRPGTSLVSASGQLLACAVARVQARERADEINGAVAVTSRLDLRSIVARLDRAGAGARVVVADGEAVDLGATRLGAGAPTREVALTGAASGTRVVVPTGAGTIGPLDAQRVGAGVAIMTVGLGAAASLLMRGRRREPSAAVARGAEAVAGTEDGDQPPAPRHSTPTVPAVPAVTADEMARAAARPTPPAAAAGPAQRPTPIVNQAMRETPVMSQAIADRSLDDPITHPRIRVPTPLRDPQTSNPPSQPRVTTRPGIPVLVPSPVPPPSAATAPAPPHVEPPPAPASAWASASPSPLPSRPRSPSPVVSPGLPPAAGVQATRRTPGLPSLDQPLPAGEDFSVHEAMTPVRNVLELKDILQAAAGPKTRTGSRAGAGARAGTRADPSALPGTTPHPGQGSSAEYEPIFRQYIELRRFYADTSEAMTFGRFVEKLRQERTLLLRQGHAAVRYDVLRESDGQIAVKVVGISR